MNGFNPLRRFLGVEQLDDRTVPSAVDVFVSQNTWVVRGDNANNSIAVTQLNATTARITGVAPEGGGTTTVNGRGFVDVSTARAIRFEMRDGNDRIDLRGSSQLKVRFPSVGIDLGGGVDTLLVNHLSTPGGFDVFTGGHTVRLRLVRLPLGPLRRFELAWLQLQQRPGGRDDSGVVRVQLGNALLAPRGRFHPGEYGQHPGEHQHPGQLSTDRQHGGQPRASGPRRRPGGGVDRVHYSGAGRGVVGR